MVKKWIGPMMKRAEQKGTKGVFSRKAKSMGISTKALAKRWYGKAGVWGKRARAAAHMMGVRPSKGGGVKSSRTRASQRKRK